MSNQLGPFELDNIYAGDSAEMLSQLPDECIDLVVSSPPYDPVTWDMKGKPVTHLPGKNALRKYKGYTWDFAVIAEQLWRVIKPGGVVVWVVADQVIKGSESCSSDIQKLYFRHLGFRVHDTMFFLTQKTPLSHNRYEQEIEYMFVLSKGRPKTTNLIRERTAYYGIDKRRNGNFTHNNGHQGENIPIREGKKRKPPNPTKIKGNCWRYNTGAGHSDDLAFQHPGTFPDGLAHDHIISWSNKGDIVLDPFMGSGTVGKMAKYTGRHYLGFDISPEYVEQAKERIAKYDIVTWNEGAGIKDNNVYNFGLFEVKE